MSSIDPTKLQAISRQQNHKLGVGVKSNKHKKTKSSAMLSNNGEESHLMKGTLILTIFRWTEENNKYVKYF